MATTQTRTRTTTATPSQTQAPTRQPKPTPAELRQMEQQALEAETARVRETFSFLDLSNTILDPARPAPLAYLPVPDGMHERPLFQRGYLPTTVCVFCRAVKDDKYTICAKCYSVAKRLAEAAVLAANPDTPEAKLNQIKPFTAKQFSDAIAHTPRKKADRAFRTDARAMTSARLASQHRLTLDRKAGLTRFVMDPEISLEEAQAFFTQYQPAEASEDREADDDSYPVEYHEEDFLYAPDRISYASENADPTPNYEVDGPEHELALFEEARRERLRIAKLHEIALLEDAARTAGDAEALAALTHMGLPKTPRTTPRAFTDAQIELWDAQVDRFLFKVRQGKELRVGAMLAEAGVNVEEHGEWQAEHAGTELPRPEVEMMYARIRWDHFVLADAEAAIKPYGQMMQIAGAACWSDPQGAPTAEETQAFLARAPRSRFTPQGARRRRLRPEFVHLAFGGRPAPSEETIQQVERNRRFEAIARRNGAVPRSLTLERMATEPVSV